MEKSELLMIVEKAIAPRGLNKIQALVLEKCWEGYSYQEISRQCGYELGYIKDTGSQLWKLLSEATGNNVTKKNLRGIVYQLQQSRGLSQRIYWGEAIDVSEFYGRSQELQTLNQWILGDRLRLVGIFAFGGMGKTSLSVKIAQMMAEEFESVVWQSLRDAPPLDHLLPPLLRFLTSDPGLEMPESVGGQLSVLIQCLQRQHVLMILDNFDSLFTPTERAGIFRPGYENYGELLTRLGTIQHQSCVIVTSREEPLEFAKFVGHTQAVRRLKLEGLDLEAGTDVLQNQGAKLTSQKSQKIIENCQGNPLALKIFATAIQDLFDNDIDSFLQENITLLSGVGQVIEQQIDRLSLLEKSILFWLAIEREPVKFSKLTTLLFPGVTLPKITTTVESLQRRSLVESSRAGFTLQPVVMEFVTEYLIKLIAEEIVNQNPFILRSHGLINATNKDYIRETQNRLIIQPIIDSLLTIFNNPNKLKQAINDLIPLLRRDYALEGNYGAANIIHLLRNLGVDFTGYDFSYLTLRQAYLQDLNLHQVDLSYGELKDCALAQTFGGITDVAFSHDGSLLATCDTLGDVQIWDSNHRQKRVCCQGHNNWVWSIAFNPDSTLLISGGQDQTVRVWEVATGHRLQVLRGHQGIVTTVAFSPDGEWIASAGQDCTVRLWHLKTGTVRHICHGHGGCIWSVRFTVDGRSVLSSSEDGTIRRWQVATGEEEAIFTGHGHWVWGLAVHPGGHWFASSSFDCTVKIWDLVTGDCVQTLRGHTQPVTAIAIDPEGQTLASSSYDQTVRRWQWEGGNGLEVLNKHSSLVWCVAFDPQGRRLVSGGDDHSAYLWQVDSGYGSICTKVIKGHSNCIYSIALAPDGQTIASAHESQVVTLWQKPDGSESFKPWQTLRGHGGRVLAVVWSGTENQVISGSCDHTVKIWQGETGECLHTLRGHRSWIWTVALSPDETLIASGSYDHTIKLWDRRSGEALGTLVGHPSSILSVKFSRDGQYLASGGYDQTLKIWRLADQSCVQTLTAHGNRIWSVDFSPDGQHLATGGDDGTVKIWDWQTGHCLQTLTGHGDQVLSVLWSRNDDALFSASGDTTIRVWDRRSGTCRHTIQGHQTWVSSLQENERWLLSGSNDATLKVWLKTQFNHSFCHQTLQIIRAYEGMKINHMRNLNQADQGTLLALGAIAGKEEHFKR